MGFKLTLDRFAVYVPSAVYLPSAVILPLLQLACSWSWPLPLAPSVVKSPLVMMLCVLVLMGVHATDLLCARRATNNVGETDSHRTNHDPETATSNRLHLPSLVQPQP